MKIFIVGEEMEVEEHLCSNTKRGLQPSEGMYSSIAVEYRAEVLDRGSEVTKRASEREIGRERERGRG